MQRPAVNSSYLVIDSLCDQAGGKEVEVVGLYWEFLASQG